MRDGFSKKSRRERYEVRDDVVPVAGVEPARVISPTDFESVTSANSITPASARIIITLFSPLGKKNLPADCFGGKLFYENRETREITSFSNRSIAPFIISSGLFPP